MLRIILISLCLTLSGCEALGMISSALPVKDGVSLDAQIGDREVNTDLGSDTTVAGKIEAEDDAVVNVTTNKSDVDKAEKVTINEGSPWYVHFIWGIIAILGWMAPQLRLWEKKDG